MGHTVEWSTANIMDDSNPTLSSRKDCIESMAVLFERLFANEPLDTSVHMWWDSLCYAWHCGNRNRERGGDDLELQDIFFQTLSKVLAREPLSTAWARTVRRETDHLNPWSISATSS